MYRTLPAGAVTGYCRRAARRLGPQTRVPADAAADP